MIFASSLDPNQARQNDLEPNCLTLMVFLKESFGEKISRQQKRMQNYPVGKELKLNNLNFSPCHRILAKKYVNLKELRVGVSIGTCPSG